MRRILLLTSLFWTLLLCTIHSGYALSIKSENTYIDSKSRIVAMKEVIYSSAMNFDYKSLSVRIDGFQREPRGRMRDAQISLSPYVAKDAEFIKLFVHELAHYIDLYILTPSST